MVSLKSSFLELITIFVNMEGPRTPSCSNRREFSPVRTGEKSLLFEQERVLSGPSTRAFSPVRAGVSSLLFDQELSLS